MIQTNLPLANGYSHQPPPSPIKSVPSKIIHFNCTYSPDRKTLLYAICNMLKKNHQKHQTKLQTSIISMFIYFRSSTKIIEKVDLFWDTFYFWEKRNWSSQYGGKLNSNNLNNLLQYPLSPPPPYIQWCVGAKLLLDECTSESNCKDFNVVKF